MRQAYAHAVDVMTEQPRPFFGIIDDGYIIVMAKCYQLAQAAMAKHFGVHGKTYWCLYERLELVADNRQKKYLGMLGDFLKANEGREFK